MLYYLIIKSFITLCQLTNQILFHSIGYHYDVTSCFRYIKNVHPSPEYTLDAEMAEPLVSRGGGGGYDLDIDLDYKDKNGYSYGHNSSTTTTTATGTGTTVRERLSSSRRDDDATYMDDGGGSEEEDLAMYFDGTSDSSDL